MNVSEFIAKWEKSELTERSSAQQHFLDLCELLGHPKPAAVDPTGASFTFEKGATKQSGGRRLCGRLEERLLRLGVQGQAQGP